MRPPIYALTRWRIGGTRSPPAPSLPDSREPLSSDRDRAEQGRIRRKARATSGDPPSTGSPRRHARCAPGQTRPRSRPQSRQVPPGHRPGAFGTRIAQTARPRLPDLATAATEPVLRSAPFRGCFRTRESSHHGRRVSPTVRNDRTPSQSLSVTRFPAAGSLPVLTARRPPRRPFRGRFTVPRIVACTLAEPPKAFLLHCVLQSESFIPSDRSDRHRLATVPVAGTRVEPAGKRRSSNMGQSAIISVARSDRGLETQGPGQTVQLRTNVVTEHVPE